VKILWVCPTYLHPTTRGGQIRTLGMLRELHRSHEIHFAALQRPEDGCEGVTRSAEYCSRNYAIAHDPPTARSPAFYTQAARSALSGMPLAISRWRSAALRRRVEQLLEEQRFDRVVCDFLAAAPNVPDIERVALFQHNVETIIWERLRDTADSPLRKMAFRYEAARMLTYERSICRAAGHVIAVSEEDADRMRSRFGVSRISAVPTGVDIDFFAAPSDCPPVADLVFVGSMNWMPNIDGVSYFSREIMPLILTRKPDCRVAIVGRTPPPSITRLAEIEPNVSVTGSVPDVRPYLWGSKVCIVPLRIGGGTRLKIYEAMAARIPVVSTSVGAEGLPVSDGENIVLADDPRQFAEACLDLLADSDKRGRLAGRAWDLVASHYSWKQAAESFERILDAAPGL
jgi:glycosyltransferase involved in cell wall biosynthesis